MKIMIISDMHDSLDWLKIFDDYTDVILVIAGDFDVTSAKHRYKTNMEQLCSRFKHVVLVAGNHEYYGNNMRSANNYLLNLENEIDNLHFLENSYTIIDGQRFIGCTLWSDIDPVYSYEVYTKMNDYNYIRTGYNNIYRKINTNDTIGLYIKSKQFLETNILEGDIVITHHSPSYLSVNETYKNSTLNSAYCSNLETLIYDTKPKIWVHGHLHNKMDYNIYDTRIICNPYGYFMENTGYEQLIIDI